MSGLPTGWAWADIGDLCSPVSKCDPTREPEQFFTYLDIGGVDGDAGKILTTQKLLGKEAPSRARQLVHSDDIIVSTVRTYMRKTALVPPDLHASVASTGFCVLRPKPGIAPRFLLHRLRCSDFVEELCARQTGSSYPAVRDQDVKELRTQLPGTAEQARIVAAIEEAFSKLDAGEAGLRSVRQRLKRMREAVLNAAVTGRLLVSNYDDGRARDGEGWCWTTLGEVAQSVRNGLFVSRPSAAPPGLPILRIGAVRPMKINLEDVRYVKQGTVGEDVSKAIIQEGDLLFTRYNGNPAFVGACAVVPSHNGPILHPDKLIRVQVKANIAYSRFVAVACSIGTSRHFIESVTKTTAGQVGISGGELKKVTIPLPPLEEQHRIVAEVERQLSFIDACERTVDAGLARAAALRRSILKAAFEGRLVPQDPSDEPASALLERIRAERSAAPASKRPARRSK